jgi:hypothetical protein
LRHCSGQPELCLSACNATLTKENRTGRAFGDCGRTIARFGLRLRD